MLLPVRLPQPLRSTKPVVRLFANGLWKAIDEGDARACGSRRWQRRALRRKTFRGCLSISWDTFLVGEPDGTVRMRVDIVSRRHSREGVVTSITLFVRSR